MIAMCGSVAAADRVFAADATAQPASNGAVPKPAGEVTAVRIGSGIVYRYKDASGHLVLLDQPPPGYAASKFENMAPPAADTPESVDAMPPAEPASPAEAGRTLSDQILGYAPWFAGIVALAVAMAWSLSHLVELSRRMLSRRRTLTSVLDRSGYDTMHGVILPLSGGRTAFFDHIVRTPSGLLVVGAARDAADTARTASARESGQGAASDRREIGREVAKLDARVEAVKALAPGVPVFGRFICTGNVAADGSVPRVVPLPAFARALPEFRRHDTANSAALNAAWQTLRTHAGRNDTVEF
jgi:hypothetical protein